ncbi:hypothetical protein PVAND_003106 [Polypedilum vanderplanki]|uniref:Uncharacterized protein n=1 Tax=Polypedilum vanderplanki TaxID=319348 RepID=A0A9J6BT27_POLVA|nr:hypothetical protein PVAND_003106 [Polypedilum vanderplanki]
MREFLLFIGLFVGCTLAAPTGPLKISDNNIENIFNINIYINGVFSNNIEQDIITVLVGLLNQQSVNVGDGMTLKDQLLQLANKAKSKDIDINVPASSMGQSLNFDGLAAKIQSALSNRANSDDKSALLPSNLEAKARELLSQYTPGGEV